MLILNIKQYIESFQCFASSLPKKFKAPQKAGNPPALTAAALKYAAKTPLYKPLTPPFYLIRQLNV